MAKKRRPGRSSARDREQHEREAAKRQRRAEARAERERTQKRRQRQTRARRIGVVGLSMAVAAGLVFLLVRSSGGGVSFEGNLGVGGRIQALTLPALDDDGDVSYAQFSDRPLVLNFFASWCPNCIAEMPRFETLHQRIGDRVGFLGVSQSDPKRASIDIARETGITYQTAIDQQGELFRAFGGVGMPVTVFIQPGGGIAEIFTGELSAELLAGKIQQHFDVAA